jgi:hypothetical protein
VTEITRRKFVKSSAVVVAGAATVGALEAADAAAKDGKVGTEPVVAYVKNPDKGEISLMSGDREVKVSDRTLAAKIARAAR